ncbi:MAG TPA: 5-oxoprolinase subunit PxpA [Ilumatobacter sp.]|nr:5-oxoprolinase subunit PxpA [Ilumatobacter sp.]
MPAIDLNADLGESYGVWRLGDDAALLDVVTSANIACGFHAGDPSTLRRTCLAATARGVAIGAQVSYPDLAGFGRRFIDIDPGELRDAVLYQLGALDAFAQVAGAGVAYVKPHGALYHACISHPAQAEAVVAAAHEYDPAMAVLGAPGSLLLARAEALGMEAVPEAYADRAYLPDGRLVPRDQPGAVLHDPAEAAAQAVTLATAGGARSICVHGDTPGAVAIAQAVRAGLEQAGIGVYAFTG